MTGRVEGKHVKTTARDCIQGFGAYLQEAEKVVCLCRVIVGNRRLSNLLGECRTLTESTMLNSGSEE